MANIRGIKVVYPSTGADLKGLLKAAFYDEDGFLVNTMYGKDIKMLGGKLLPGRMEVVPADEPGKRTIIEYLRLEFDRPIEDTFFSLQNMKRVN